MTELMNVTTAGAGDLEGMERRTARVLGVFEVAMALVESKVSELRAQSPDKCDAKGLEALLRDLNKSLGSINELEGKIEDARRIERGGDGIDLDAAWAEVSDRLARLSRAGGTD